MIVILFILVIGTVIIFEYLSHCNLFPYRLFKLDDAKLSKLGFTCITKNKSKLTIFATYQYKSILLKVNRQRFTPLNTIGSAEIYKNNKRICNYSQLPKSFRTGVYAKYLYLRYPKLSKLIQYQSKDQSSKYKQFCEKEDLLSYYGIINEKSYQ